MQCFSCIHAEDLQVFKYFLLLLEINQEFLVVLISMRYLYTVAVLILDLTHG
jgi:hypothetical protein